MTSDVAKLLAKSRRLLASTSHLAKQAAAAPAAPAPAAFPPPAGGPVNLYMKLEGRRFATDVVLSAQALLKMPGGAQELIGNLQRACAGRPSSYAAGITEIIDLIRSQENRPCA